METLTVVATFAAITDWFDGLLARHWGCVTDMGAELDIWADKMLCLTLAGIGVVAIVRQDNLGHLIPIMVLVLYHGVVMVKRVTGSLLFRPSRVAQLKTFVEMPGLISAIGYLDFLPVAWVDSTNQAGTCAVWIAAVLSAWSMLHYLDKVPDWPMLLWPRKQT